MKVGSTGRVQIVAELGSSHRKSYSRAMALINAAHGAGADAVKIPAFIPSEMTLDSDQPPFIIEKGPWAGRTLYSLYEESALCYDFIPDLKRAVEALGMEFILSIYHPNTVPWAVQCGCRTIKIASFEVGYTELLEAVAAERAFRHVIVSLGGSTAEERTQVHSFLTQKQATFLHCVSEYPAFPGHMNLRTVRHMQEGLRLDYSVGLSDHSQTITAPVVAVALGATMVEKHLTLDDESLDSGFAIYPDRFRLMVEAVRQAEAMMGEVTYNQPKTFHRQLIDGRMLRVVHGGGKDDGKDEGKSQCEKMPLAVRSRR